MADDRLVPVKLARVVLRDGAALTTTHERRYLLGCDWTFSDPPADLSSHPTWEVGSNFTSDRTGLRCARSVRQGP